ncbi:MAG: hypothetical protein JXB46_01480 [Candidatus Eisenbacteria bacterium]|nr:hypothetical protein [Candidatus Eisenbacteria bacterium]
MMLAQPQNNGPPQSNYELHKLRRILVTDATYRTIFDGVPLLAASHQVFDVGASVRPEDHSER